MIATELLNKSTINSQTLFSHISNTVSVLSSSTHSFSSRENILHTPSIFVSFASPNSFETLYMNFSDSTASVG
ncbi:AEH_G0017950.mRNA.1.CDS.1 [Saccharomyces cerevisiae]|nr:CNB_1a_G0017590.mRNA.1.CDS.1 [Saccharomyces cerevisiae]CAI4463028.1 AEH_G0017950.mRNA.1.CDS.1 [Saccharomyces cerevisiae]CAI5278412.1 CNT_HP2_G0018910.mRNA.1.CDS.1 [Saccharomyces cerevisiae]CAI6535405.1 CNT_HP1_G0016260.mRNA.1.CDS.1 [Saccharomyces cerevisiae]CAI6542526.1 CNT_HP2_G0018910.mRNA.1.CDS.1 [Saccharomyces cerevisiae]